MNFDPPSPAGRSSTPQHAEWKRQIEAWREELDQCTQKPSRKRVHALRSATLRLQTALNFRLLQQAPDAAAARAVRRWNKAGKKLRRWLQPVRDADVHLARLDSLLRPRSERAVSRAPLSPRAIRELGRLKSRLERRRKAGADQFQSGFDPQHKRLIRLSREVEAELAAHPPANSRSAAPAALELFAGLAGEFPHLDSANLHEYRKRLKHALYLAELSAATDPAAAALAAAFRKIHGAAGEWHDWQMLAQEAASRLGNGGKPDGLIPVLEKLAEEALQKALNLCLHTAERFLKAGGSQPSLPRKPVAPEPGFAPGDESVPLRIAG